MSKPKAFIDGQEGTTGLPIHDRLAGRDAVFFRRLVPEL